VNSATAASPPTTSDTKCAATSTRAIITNATIASSGRARGYTTTIGITMLANSSTCPDGNE